MPSLYHYYFLQLIRRYSQQLSRLQSRCTDIIDLFDLVNNASDVIIARTVNGGKIPERIALLDTDGDERSLVTGRSAAESQNSSHDSKAEQHYYYHACDKSELVSDSVSFHDIHLLNKRSVIIIQEQMFIVNTFMNICLK